jgi:molybdate transport system substrate-binding protein
MMSSALLAALVAAAISLKAPLEDAAKQFATASPGEEVTFTFGSSGQLAAQIEQGAPVDLFVSASPVDVDRLAAAHRIEIATRAAIAGNRLVVVVPRGTKPPESLAGLVDPRFRRIAIGNVKTVPAGRYAREALVASNLLSGVEKRFVYAENVRQVVDIVAGGEADAGFVYATDIPLGGDRIDLAFQVPDRLHAPIVNEGALVLDAKSAARARAFLAFLRSPAGRALFVERGFLEPRTAATK